MLFCTRSNSRAGKKFLKSLNYRRECFKQAQSICTLILTMIKSESNISSTGHWTVAPLASIEYENIYGKLQKCPDDCGILFSNFAVFLGHLHIDINFVALT